ncbi:MAG: hypothetical protein ACK4SM_06190 [Aquificaceae bacterium]
MRFYLIAFLLAFVQSSLLTGIFVSSLYAPDLVLLYLFYSLYAQTRLDIEKPVISGFFLDLMYDTLGWNMLGKLTASFFLELIKSRYILVSRLSVLVSYMAVAILEHALRFFLFRLKYYYSFSPALFMLGLVTEGLFLMTFTSFIIKGNAKA